MFSREPISFTATSSNSGRSSVSLIAARPIRPSPLMATLWVMVVSSNSGFIGCIRGCAPVSCFRNDTRPSYYATLACGRILMVGVGAQSRGRASLGNGLDRPVQEHLTRSARGKVTMPEVRPVRDEASPARRYWRDRSSRNSRYPWS